MRFRELMVCGFACFVCVGSPAHAGVKSKKLPSLDIKIQRAKETCQVKPPAAKRKTPLKICQTRYDLGIFNTSSNKIHVELLCRVLGGKAKFKPELHFDAVPNKNMNLPVIAVRFPDVEKGRRVRKTSCVLRAERKDLVIF